MEIRKTNRWGVIVFVAVFVASVLILLTGNGMAR
jgi:hypothetical protein